MKKSLGFTLAEALITLTIIGVIAAICIPSVISNNKSVQSATAMKKAVKTVNEAISLNIAKGERSALQTGATGNTLFDYLQKNLDVIKTTTNFNKTGNKAFFTADGMRFEIPKADSTLTGCTDSSTEEETDNSRKSKTSACGTSGLDIGGTTGARAEKPCTIIIDTNGDKKPNKYSDETELNDIFIMLITDKAAFPCGEAAQKAYYGNK